MAQFASPRSVPFLKMLMASVFILGTMPGVAMAQQDVVNAMTEASTQKIQVEKEIAENLKKTVTESMNDLSRSFVDTNGKTAAMTRTAAPIDEIAIANTMLPIAMATANTTVDDVMFNRYRELNRIPIGTTEATADYLVDSSYGSDDTVQAFSIFMRYFCDTRSRQNAKEDDTTLKSRTYTLENAMLKGKETSYKVGCGFSEGSVPSRQTYLGAKEANDGVYAQQIIGLPARPQVLFFAPETFPTKLPDGAGTDKVSNTNPLSHIYYAAFAQSLQFLLGGAPKAYNADGVGGEKAFLDAQAEIAKKTLASYPFAILFSERVGTLPGDPNTPDESVPRQLADLLQDKLAGATEDPTMLQRIDNIRKRNAISIAEYNDIVMYQLMMSPGYYERISRDLDATQLRREEVWLTAMQTALNYQRNRWLEILAALEAVK